jgi:diaminopimelate decarboxylase
MDHFQYRGGVLHAEDVSLPRIAAVVGTPAYVYSTATMERHYRVFAEGFAGTDALICYALKANSNQAVIRTFAELGAGADVVSIGELKRALAAGVPPQKIVFAGVGKTREEMAAALEAGIFQFNVESEPELELLSEAAAARGQVAPVAVRVNPDVDALTHAKISTGKRENKFGIPWDRARAVYERARRLPGVKAVGVAVHIGSQLTDLAPFEQAFRRVGELAQALRQEGHPIERLDLGGGLGIPYQAGSNAMPPPPADYAAMARRTVGHLGFKLVLEPGRLLVGNAGVLLARVIYVKTEGRRFVIIDAAMNDLIRPSMYDAWHDIAPVREPRPGAPAEAADIVGPVCESADVLAANRKIPPLAPDDLIAIRSAGAYGAVMSSTYNSRALAPEVLVKGAEFAIVRRRQSLEELIALDALPPWLEPPKRGGPA